MSARELGRQFLRKRATRGVLHFPDVGAPIVKSVDLKSTAKDLDFKRWDRIPTKANGIPVSFPDLWYRAIVARKAHKLPDVRYGAFVKRLPRASLDDAVDLGLDSCPTIWLHR
jgi:hypothetical protein